MKMRRRGKENSDWISRSLLESRRSWTMAALSPSDISQTKLGANKIHSLLPRSAKGFRIAPSLRFLLRFSFPSSTRETMSFQRKYDSQYRQSSSERREKRSGVAVSYSLAGFGNNSISFHGRPRYSHRKWNLPDGVSFN